MLSARTRLAAVIGHPVRHSLSPTIFNAAFEAAGLDWAYAAFEVAEGNAPTAVAGARALGIDGLSVTMPHKAAVIPALDELTPDAEALGAVNCIARAGDRLVGHNTDGPGLVDALAVDEGLDLSGRRVVVVGAGGAARAVIRSIARAGAASVVVVNRSPEPAERAAALGGAVARVGRPEDVAEADVVVNATPLGMGAVTALDGQPEPLPLDPERLGAGQVVVDLIYHPPVTPLLAAARAKGLVAVNGLGMLVHQAAHAYRIWTQEEPPLAAMSAAVVAALEERTRSD